MACLVGLLAFAHYGNRALSLAEWVLFGFLSTTTLALPRLGRRMYDWYLAYAHRQTPRRRALVVGGGDTGEVVMREMRRNPQVELRVIGFVDDDPRSSPCRFTATHVWVRPRTSPKSLRSTACRM